MDSLQISSWAKFSEYEVINIDGRAYIIPTKDSYASIYDPSKDERSLLCDALNLGKYLFENDLGHKESVLDFVHKYVLLGIMTDITDSDLSKYESVIIHEKIFIKPGSACSNGLAKVFFPKDNIDISGQQTPKIRLQSRAPVYTKMFLRMYRYAEPLEWIVKYFNFLYLFMECSDEKLCEFNSPQMTYRIDTHKEPRLICEYASHKAVIDFAFAKAVTDERKPLRYCKHCGKVFYANDPRTEFCSPNCRNQFNVYKSRARH